MSLTVTLSVIHPSPGCGWIRPSPGCGWMLARIGRLSGFQPRVSGPRVPEAGKLRLRKELGTARKALNRLPRHHHHLLYKLQARQLQSKVLSRLENLDHQPLAENLLVYHYRWNICSTTRQVEICRLLYMDRVAGTSSPWHLETSFYQQSTFQTTAISLFLTLPLSCFLLCLGHPWKYFMCTLDLKVRAKLSLWFLMLEEL